MTKLTCLTGGFPTGLGNFPLTLSLESGDFSSFPLEILELCSLKILFANYNNISFIPSTLTKLSNLEQLSLGFNAIRDIPGFIVSSLSLTEESQAKQLQVYRN